MALGNHKAHSKPCQAAGGKGPTAKPRSLSADAEPNKRDEKAESWRRILTEEPQLCVCRKFKYFDSTENQEEGGRSKSFNLLGHCE
ncbi:Transcription regulator protein BACH1 [Manis javanica]|nr:Transcription regulator protein BACH1 [Manis javanica]